MGCRLPVVGTDIASLKDLIVGKSVPVGNPVALAEAIESMLNLPVSEKKSLREKSLKKAIGPRWKKNAEMRLGYYKATIEHGPFSDS
jgi:glycosyltransferase involved in cell wall biosynthesis